jgi:hypothetical protein
LTGNDGNENECANAARKDGAGNASSNFDAKWSNGIVIGDNRVQKKRPYSMY